MGNTRAHKPRYRLTRERIAALMFLLVLAAGLSIINLTEGWMGSLPYHDHLLLNARGIGLVHHAHQGDALDHAQCYLASIAATPVVGQPRPAAIVSLRPLTAQPELNSATFFGWVDAFALPLSLDAGVLALCAALLLASGRRYAPPFPPPRFA